MCFYWVQFRFPQHYKYAVGCSESRVPAFRGGEISSSLAGWQTNFGWLTEWEAAQLADTLCLLVCIGHNIHHLIDIATFPILGFLLFTVLLSRKTSFVCWQAQTPYCKCFFLSLRIANDNGRLPRIVTGVTIKSLSVTSSSGQTGCYSELVSGSDKVGCTG